MQHWESCPRELAHSVLLSEFVEIEGYIERAIEFDVSDELDILMVLKLLPCACLHVGIAQGLTRIIT